ncbi:S8 family serine peptidase [Streptosporangium sp. NPDC000396]|uniref:S8 family peptidase n=1 Tax=Streptosporangium sp. NPDC000396 TaxID=3366185 RepID=UPI00367F55C0
MRRTRPLAAGVMMAAALATPTGVALAEPTPPPPGKILKADPTTAIPGRYIVVLKNTDDLRTRGVAPEARTLAEEYGGEVKHTYSTVVKGFAVSLPQDQAEKLAADPAVAYVEQDQEVTVSDTQNDPPSWGLDRIDQRDLPLSKSYTYTGTADGVRVYVIDTGIRITHGDFGGRASYGRDLLDGDNDAGDCNGHGTHVSGTAGGTRYGVAKKARLIGVRVLGCDGTGPNSTTLAGVEWVAANGTAPAVVNVSVKTSPSQALTDAVRASVAKGFTYVVAAANDNADACDVAPAQIPEVIAVGATDNTDRRRSTSNYGPCLDLFAPGGNITSAWHTGDTASNTISGTSMASPHVAGAAALYLGAHPGATPAQITDAILAAATPGKVTDPGRGSPNKLLHIPPAAACGPFTDAQGAELADRASVERPVTVSGCPGSGSVAARVTVNARHTYRGDLAVDLIAPGGTVHPLKAADPDDSAADLTAEYAVDLTSETRDGVWRLRVRDAYKTDTGTIVSWSLAP